MKLSELENLDTQEIEEAKNDSKDFSNRLQGIMQDKWGNTKGKERKMNEEKFYCSVCGKEISTEEYESYDGLCWECWDDQMTEECEFEEDII